MAFLSRTETVSDGVTATFSVGFPFLDRTHVQVFTTPAGGTIAVAYTGVVTFVSDALVSLNPIPANGVLVSVRRATPNTGLVITLTAPSTFSAAENNLVFTQLLYLAQEATDAGTDLTAAGIVIVPTGSFGLGSAASPSMTFIGDTDTGIFSPLAGKIAITADGLENFRFQRNGVNREFGSANLIDNLIGGQHAADFMHNGDKTYLRSLIITESGDTADLAIRRVNGTLSAPTPLLLDELEGVFYWQPWLGDPRGWGTGISPAEGRSAMLFSRSTEPNATRGAPDYFSGGNFVMGVTRHGQHTIQERVWVNHDGSMVIAGNAREPNGLVDSTSVNGLANQKAFVDIYVPDETSRPFLGFRHDDDISEGFYLRMNQGNNELSVARSIEDVLTEIARLTGDGLRIKQDIYILNNSAAIAGLGNVSILRRSTATGDLEIVASGNVAGRRVIIEKKAGDGDIIVGTNGTEIKGWVTKPGNPAAQAVKTATQTDVTGAGAVVTVLFETETYDQSANYDPVTGIFTAPVTGKYRFSSTVTLGGLTAAASRAVISAVGTPKTFSAEGGDPQPDVNSRFTLEISGTILLAAAQTLKIQVAVEGEATDVVDILGETAIGNAGTAFSVELIA
jgi:hypothetical protein